MTDELNTTIHARHPRSPASDKPTPAIAVRDRAALLKANTPNTRPRKAKAQVSKLIIGIHTVKTANEPKTIDMVSADGLFASMVGLNEAVGTVFSPIINDARRQGATAPQK